MERAVVEGALEAARKDNSRLQGELATLRATLRRGGTIEAIATEEPPVRPKHTRADLVLDPMAENIAPIVKA
jgi:hypothetical protein